MSLLNRNDEDYMRVALRQAEQAFAAGEVPIGAIVVYKDQIIARAFNQVEMLKDATAHAEILAITQASAAIGDWRLQDATLYVTKEPCAMCAGAMVNAKLGKLVFAVPDERCGCAGSAIDITGYEGMLHKVEVESGILKDECLMIIQEFFQMRRLQAKQAKQQKKYQ